MQKPEKKNSGKKNTSLIIFNSHIAIYKDSFFCAKARW